MKGSKSLLFPENKKQKDFYDLAPGLDDRRSHESFLVLFFKKERASFLD
jgi:hypothetical protein